MMQKPALWLTAVWYDNAATGFWLRPFSAVYRQLVVIRRFLYRHGVFKQYNLSVPVIIVGNITVGGTGKTPLIIWLAKYLRASGFNPGIISRGYGGAATDEPQTVTPESDVKRVGDEAVLIAKHADCPVVVSSRRVKAAERVLKQASCDVILSDDGLQHYALARDIEIAVIDGARQFGNGLCLPAGPLREPPERIDEVDFVVVNGETSEGRQFAMTLSGDSAINLVSGEVRPLSDFAATGCHAVAGIGNPGRFFNLLEAAGVICTPHPFPDHYAFAADDMIFNGESVLMTEKDAVKCTGFARMNHWYVPVAATLATGFAEQLLCLLREKHGSKTT